MLAGIVALGYCATKLCVVVVLPVVPSFVCYSGGTFPGSPLFFPCPSWPWHGPPPPGPPKNAICCALQVLAIIALALFGLGGLAVGGMTLCRKAYR